MNQEHIDTSLQGGDNTQSESAAAKIEEMPAFATIDNHYYKSTVHNGKVYDIAYLKNDDSLLEPRGFYNKQTFKINYEEDLDKNPEYDKIYDEILESLGEIEVDSLTKIKYLRNLVDDSVYLNDSKNKVKIGELVDDNGSEKDVSDKKIKFD